MILPGWFWRVIRSRRFKILAMVLPVAIVVGIVGYYQGVNWWSKRAAEKFRGKLLAEGYPVDAEAEKRQEAYLATVKRMSSEGEPDKLNRLRNMPWPGRSNHSRDWRSVPDLAQPHDVRRWLDPARVGGEEEVAAKEILATIGALGWIDQYEENKARIHSWDSPMVFTHIGGTSFALDLALLRMVAGDPEGSFRLMENVNKGMLRPVSFQMVHLLSSFFTKRQARETIWEGVYRGVWNDRQLNALQRSLEIHDTRLDDIVFDSLRNELAFMAIALKQEDVIREGIDLFGSEGKDAAGKLIKHVFKGEKEEFLESLDRSWFLIRPEGGIRLEYLEGMEILHSEISKKDRSENKGISLSDLSGYGSEVNPYRFDRVGKNVFVNVGIRTLEVRTLNRLLMCGIALERYRLKYGEAPETLEVLVPEFLAEIPKDVCDGAPLRYQRLPDGHPHVWSLWPSGVDEGGMPNLRRTKNTVCVSFP